MARLSPGVFHSSQFRMVSAVSNFPTWTEVLTLGLPCPISPTQLTFTEAQLYICQALGIDQ